MCSARRRVLCILAVLLSSCAIEQPLVRQFADGRQWQLWEPLAFEFGQGRTVIEVPAGFVTDFASIPQSLWNILPPHGRYSSPAVLHDYLYWVQACSKDEADLAFLYAMEEQSVPFATRMAVYAGVRTPLSQAAWDRNAEERRAGRVRVIPTHLRNVPPGMTWEAYRAEIEKRGARDPDAGANAELCRVFSSLAR